MSAEGTSFKREMLATLPSLRAFAVSLTGKHDKADRKQVSEPAGKL